MVTVALGLGQTFEYYHSHTFAQQRAVGIPVERAQLAAMRQRAELREDHHQHRRGIAVDAAGEGQIALSAAQLPRGHFDRHQGTGARGVDQIVRAHQVQAVGDTPRNDIRHQPGGSVRIELRQAGL